MQSSFALYLLQAFRPRIPLIELKDTSHHQALQHAATTQPVQQQPWVLILDAGVLYQRVAASVHAARLPPKPALSPASWNEARVAALMDAAGCLNH